MTDASYMLEWNNDTSQRLAVLEDDGTSAWLYLTVPNNRKPIADVWVHNRIAAPPQSEIKKYRGGPPPAASGFADDSDVCQSPDEHEWTLDWHDNGESVILHCDGKPVAMLAASGRRGWSRNLLRDGPWGNVWDDELYSTQVQNGG